MFFWYSAVDIPVVPRLLIVYRSCYIRRAETFDIWTWGIAAGQWHVSRVHSNGCHGVQRHHYHTPEEKYVSSIHTTWTSFSYFLLYILYMLFQDRFWRRVGLSSSTKKFLKYDLINWWDCDENAIRSRRIIKLNF